MPAAGNHYAGGPEALLVSLAGKGDREAFTELVRRRQSGIRNLMRRCCGDVILADDLSQHAFLQAWRKIRRVREPEQFGSWLKRIAVSEWMQYQRRHDPLWRVESHEDAINTSQRSVAKMAMDLDQVLASLPSRIRLCVILAYHERMSHGEIANITDVPLGTVKSHIRRGSEQLREQLSAHGDSP